MMDLSAEEKEAIQTLFREEANDQLAELARVLETLPDRSGGPFDAAIQVCFRIAHNIKGAALSVGFPVVADLAHAIETTFVAARDSGEALPPALIQGLLEASSIILDLLEGRHPQADPEDMIQRLENPAVIPAPGLAAGAKDSPPVGSAASPADDHRPPTQAEARQASVRVETQRLDQLMGHAGELFVAQARQDEHIRRLASLRQEMQRAWDRLRREDRRILEPIAASVAELLLDGENTRARLGYLVETIHDDLKRVRMLPLQAEEPAWRRVVRDTARTLDKQVRLDVEVGDIELDRHVLTSLRDPFVHFLRNAVDHGLESPEERTSLGKPTTGSIQISAKLHGGMVRLEVSDDGRGLDADRIGTAAVTRGALTEAEVAQMSQAQLLALLFSPGFTTAGRVSQISGRGVGLDVVRERIDSLGGSVTISETPRLGGTTFVLLLPVSLLSTRGLLVRVGQNTFGLPIDFVYRVMTLRNTTAGSAAGPDTVTLDGEPIPLRSLSSATARASSAPADSIRVVVVMRDKQRLGLIVDEILGEQDFVTQRLPWNLRKLSGISGALVQADGSVGIVVDVGPLFEARAPSAAQELGPEVEPDDPTQIHVLVVDDSLTSRMVERAMLTDAGYQVSLADDGAQAWDLLQTGEIDLVVADVQMPSIDGFELTRMVRASEALRHLPVVLVTNLGSAKDIALGAAAGADEHLVKGTFERSDLLSAIRRLL